MDQRPANFNTDQGPGGPGAGAHECRREPMPLPAALPAWVTGAFIEETIRAWQPASKTLLTQDDAIEIIMNMSRLLDVLLDKDAG